MSYVIACEHAVKLVHSGGESIDITSADLANREHNVAAILTAWLRDHLEAACRKPARETVSR
jgi:hypothetical protein